MTILADTITFAGFGILGCAIRSFITFLSSTRKPRKSKDSSHLVLYVLTLISVGAFMGIALGFSYPLSFLGGYLGMDLIDTYYKVFKRVKVDVPIKSK